MMPNENQKTITAWAQSNFGVLLPLVVAARMHCEVVELLAGTVAEASDAHLGGELADIGVMLFQVAELIGFNLDQRREMGFKKDGIDEGYVEQFGTDRTGLALGINYHSFDIVTALAGGYRPLVCRHSVRRLLIGLEHFCALLKVDLRKAIDNKMVINRGRVWVKKPNGHFQHKE